MLKKERAEGRSCLLSSSPGWWGASGGVSVQRELVACRYLIGQQRQKRKKVAVFLFQSLRFYSFNQLKDIQK
jgi:hypothetical protein